MILLEQKTREGGCAVIWGNPSAQTHLIHNLLFQFKTKAKAEAMIPFAARLPSTTTTPRGSQSPLQPDSGSFHPFLLLLYLSFTQPITKLSKNFLIRLKKNSLYVLHVYMGSSKT